MKTFARFVTCSSLIVSLTGVSAFTSSAEAAKGKDFPNTTCTCQGCGDKGGDVTGQCDTVCKDKTVYSKGSEPHDYCKAARVRLPRDWNRAVPAGGLKAN